MERDKLLWSIARAFGWGFNWHVLEVGHKHVVCLTCKMYVREL